MPACPENSGMISRKRWGFSPMELDYYECTIGIIFR